MNHLYTCVKKTQTYHTLVAVASQKTRHTSTATSTFEARAPSPARTCSLAPTRQEAPCRAFPPPSPAPWAAPGARARALGAEKGAGAARSDAVQRLKPPQIHAKCGRRIVLERTMRILEHIEFSPFGIIFEHMMRSKLKHKKASARPLFLDPLSYGRSWGKGVALKSFISWQAGHRTGFVVREGGAHRL